MQVGRDPVAEKKAVREAPKVKDLGDRFLSEYAVKLSTSSQRNCKIMGEAHSAGAGNDASRRGDMAGPRAAPLQDARHALHGEPNPRRCFEGLGPRRSLGLVAQGPSQPSSRPRSQCGAERSRALEEAELAAVGQALARESNALSAAARRACMLVGCRPKEMRMLSGPTSAKRSAGGARKVQTGPRSLYLGKPAAELIASQPRIAP